MIFLSAFTTGFQRVMDNKRLWRWLYVLNLGFALVVAIPAFNLMESKVGDSLAISQLMENFDYTLVQDFLREYGGEFSVIMQEAQVVVLVYFLFSIFLIGSILTKLRAYPQLTFLGGGAKYFARLLRLTVYFLLLHGLLLFVVGGLFMNIYFVNFKNFASEIAFFQGLKIFATIYGVLALLLFMVQDYAKIGIVHQEERSVFQTFWSSFRLTLSNWRSTLPLYLLNGFIFMIIFGIYWWISGYFHPVDTGWKIVLTFLLGQLFLIARIGCKLLNLGSATVLYELSIDNQTKN